jgi:hypothetical protein
MALTPGASAAGDWLAGVCERGVLDVHAGVSGAECARGAGEAAGFLWRVRRRCSACGRRLGRRWSFGHAHHIQQLMVTGLYALLFGVAGGGV